jgi:hypothetical protein
MACQVCGRLKFIILFFRDFSYLSERAAEMKIWVKPVQEGRFAITVNRDEKVRT